MEKQKKPLGRPRKIEETLESVEPKEIPIEEMPLTSLREYRQYNERARALNKQLGMCKYQIKPCPEELHPKERIVFQRKDQPSNPLDVFLSDDMIDFKQKLIPGRTYDLPKYVVSYLQSKGKNVWETTQNPDGS
jgi:hypothetical protein